MVCNTSIHRFKSGLRLYKESEKSGSFFVCPLYFKQVKFGQHAESLDFTGKNKNKKIFLTTKTFVITYELIKGIETKVYLITTNVSL